MSSKKADLQKVLNAIEVLSGEVSALNQRVTQLESLVSEAAAPEAAHLNEELVLTLSAAIAAYLGVEPHIRQIRLVGTAWWAQSGRATIQDSHHIAPRHG